MEQVLKMDRSLVVNFDIEGFTKENPEQQAMLVRSFIEDLDSRLDGLGSCKPDVFSTGDRK